MRDENIRSHTRRVEIERGPNGFGFVLRGAKNDGPIAEFTPSPAFPAVQYLESVDPKGPAYEAGLRDGDFIIEINGISIIRAGHRQAVDLIRGAIGVLRITATSVITNIDSGTGTATIIRTPRRQMSAQDIQEMDERHHGQRSVGRSATSNTRTRPERTSSSSRGVSSIITTMGSRSTSPAPSDQSGSSTQSGGKRTKPPPPVRLNSTLTSTQASQYVQRLNETPPSSPSLSTFGSPQQSNPSKDSSRRPSVVEIPKAPPLPVSKPPASLAGSTSSSATTTIIPPTIPVQSKTLPKPEKPKRPESIRRLNSSDSLTKVETKTVNYDTVEEVDRELSAIAKKKETLDPTAPFAIALSAKYRTLTKRKERLQSLPTAEDIAERFANAENGSNKNRNPSDCSLPPPPLQPQKEAKSEKAPEVAPQSPDSLLSEQAADKGEVLRRFDLCPQDSQVSKTQTKYPFEIPEPRFDVPDSGTETYGSSSTGSSGTAEKHQQFLQLQMRFQRDALPEETSYLSTRQASCWTTKEVVTWLEANNFEQYSSEFQENDISGENLLDLTKEELTEMGVTKIGHRKTLLNLIQRLKEPTMQ
ncbi:Oidioi.mRNA.OKI2018_I69.chr2.g8021.t1.cds [Oikopleura dioica]|uniref:Oidioi.mRNA.OKI2018_I69.chr2.g8021.t1.cds n=1 Tax=Oikopleura dioica TaxID=34765 RepID=A0ABN7T7Z1_OIKDI|nr:Oidioi.mRNA.OKI2018_I69.chr2.g8021.t1.cds [Oikopleura dioica]